MIHSSVLRASALVIGLFVAQSLHADQVVSGTPTEAVASPVITGSPQANDRVAILGDSITEQKNYSAIIEDYLIACQPAQGLQVAQFGWGGEATWGFTPRMARDVLWFSPNIATINYGMNDGGYQKVDNKRLEDYRTNTKQIIENLKSAGTRIIIVGGPGVVDPDSFGRGHDLGLVYNETLKTFGEAARAVAKDEGVAFADLNTVMMNAMLKFKQLHPKESFVGRDGIHPDNVGHTVMAYAFLKAMGCSGDIGTINVDFNASTATATDGHKILSASAGTVEIESTRYPFVVGKSPDPLSISAAMDVIPFQQDLNRFNLVVSNIPSGKRAKVTWSEVADNDSHDDRKPVIVSEEFDADQLAKGINLSSAFASNPFEHAFSRVDAAVHAQQDFETPLTKQWIHNEKTLAAQVPSAAAAFQDVAESGKKFDVQLRKVTSAVVVPVRHKIKIELLP